MVIAAAVFVGIVSIIFVDLVGFTSRAEKLDPEDVHEIVRRGFELITTEIHRFEGSRAARHIVGQPASTVDPSAWLREGGVVIVNTARGTVGDNAAALIGGTLLNLVTLAVYGALSAVIFLLILELQQVVGYSPVQAGVATLPITALLLIISLRAGKLAQRIGPRLPLSPQGFQYTAQDAPGALLPNGNVLFAVSGGAEIPAGGYSNPPLAFFEFDGHRLIAEPTIPNAPFEPSGSVNLLVLPTGQILAADGSKDVEIYTPDKHVRDHEQEDEKARDDDPEHGEAA